MPNIRKPPLQVKIPYVSGVKRGVVIAFEQRLEELGLQRSATIEHLMEEFLINTKTKKK